MYVCCMFCMFSLLSLPFSHCQSMNGYIENIHIIKVHCVLIRGTGVLPTTTRTLVEDFRDMNLSFWISTTDSYSVLYLMQTLVKHNVSAQPFSILYTLAVYISLSFCSLDSCLKDRKIWNNYYFHTSNSYTKWQIYWFFTLFIILI